MSKWVDRTEYDLYVPTVDERGNQLDPDARARARRSLVDAFGGLTDMKHRNEGLWKVGGTTVRDEVVVWRVVSAEGDEGDAFVSRVAEELRTALGQDAILVVRRRVSALESSQSP